MFGVEGCKFGEGGGVQVQVEVESRDVRDSGQATEDGGVKPDEAQGQQLRLVGRGRGNRST